MTKSILLLLHVPSSFGTVIQAYLEHRFLPLNEHNRLHQSLPSYPQRACRSCWKNNFLNVPPKRYKTENELDMTFKEEHHNLPTVVPMLNCKMECFSVLLDSKIRN